MCLLFLVEQARAYLPERTFALEGTSSHVNGPNCWNGALYAAGVVDELRMFTPSEWLEALNTACYEVKTPRPGDIGRLFHPTEGEVHGFIHLDDETIFAKHGEQTQYGYQTMSYNEMLEDYGRTRRCRQSQDFSASCFHQIRYYACDRKIDLPNPWKRASELFEELTFSEQTQWKYRATCFDEPYEARLAIALQIKELLESTQVDLPLVRESFREQLYRVELSNRNFTCRPSSVRRERDQVFRELRELLRKERSE